MVVPFVWWVYGDSCRDQAVIEDVAAGDRDGQDGDDECHEKPWLEDRREHRDLWRGGPGPADHQGEDRAEGHTGGLEGQPDREHGLQADVKWDADDRRDGHRPPDVGSGEGGQLILGDELVDRGSDRHADEHGQDRKSTRLNSSHVAISYAVFCLKKKTCADHFY